MFTAGVQRRFVARHFLAGAGQAEAVPHDHPYLVEWRCSSRRLNSRGFAADIAAMEAGLERILGGLDSVLLNDLPFFRDRQASLENLALYLHFLLRELDIDSGSRRPRLEVIIWESDTAWASFVK